MIYTRTLKSALLSLPMMALASCNGAAVGDSAPSASSSNMESTASGDPFAVTEFGMFEDPWALAVHPVNGNIFVVQQEGAIKFIQPGSGKMGFVSGVPEVDYGGQGGLGDMAFAPDFATSNTIYLTWAEAGSGNTRGAVMGRGQLVCEDHDSCDIRGLDVIWRQTPKVTGRGHYSHRIEFSPDGRYLFLASGDRQKMEPAQDLSNNLGTILRLNLDGSAADGNPFADRGEPSDQIWSYGHRNVLGLKFDGDGRLWDLEHGPAGGDELNVVKAGANYGWPVVSNGKHYSGEAIPDHSARPEFAAPALSWTPVIAPGDFIFYSGNIFPAWKGDALIAGLKTQAIIQVHIDGESASEVARYDMDNRLRDVAQGPDGAVWVLEDGDEGRLLRLTAPN